MIKTIRKTTKGDISAVILATVKTSGLIATALVAPNALKMFAEMGLVSRHKRQQEVIKRARNILIKNGCLVKDKKGFLYLTEKGERKLQSYELSNYTFSIPRVWDKKWRVLIFDIPEQKKVVRERVRKMLAEVGFKRAQDSVWIFPYDCEELIVLLKAEFSIGKDLLYLEVDKIENDHHFRKWFDL